LGAHDMPVSYRIDHERRVVLARADGRVAPEDFSEFLDALAGDAGFDPEIDLLFDLRGISGDWPPTSVVRHFVEHPIFAGSARKAYVASGDLTFGLVRMFEMMRADPAGNIRAFRDMDEARAWLGLD
jgi:hypothetical protein